MTELNKEFKQYLSGKVKIDNICDMLVEDIKNNNKEMFSDKWNIFRQKFTNIESLNITKIWHSLIEHQKTEWFEILPFNKSSHALIYAARKYYMDNNDYNKMIFEKCYVEMSKISKSTVLKELESLKIYTKISVYDSNNKKLESYLSVILEIDDLYRLQKPQNPDKFLTYMIITQGKQIEAKNVNVKIEEDDFFKEVTLKLIEKLIHVNGMGANKLNNKKDSQSLNQLYDYFQKYYQYVQLDTRLSKLPENNLNNKRNKI